MKSNKMLFWSATLLVPLILLNVWLDRHLTPEIYKITYLLLILLIALSIDLLLVSTKDTVKHYANKYNNDFNGPIDIYEHIATAVNSPHYSTLAVCFELVIMGILFLQAARLNIFVFWLMVALVPIEILSYRQLYRVLANRSKSLREMICGGEELLAATTQAICLDTANHNIWTDIIKFISTYKTVPNNIRILELANWVARTIIVVLAVYDYINSDIGPLTLVTYFIVLPLYFTRLSSTFGGHLTKQDLLNSIKYIDDVQSRSK